MDFLKKELASIKAGFKENIHKKQYWVYALSILIPIIVAVYNELGRSVDTNTLVVLGNVLLGILGLSGLFSASSSVSDETVTAQLNFWKDLNVYAVSQRGEEARCEFIAEKIETNSNN